MAQPLYVPVPLTARQLQVLKLNARGLSAADVGLALGITARTVAFHLYRIAEVLDLDCSNNHAGLAAWYVRHIECGKDVTL